MVGRAYRMGPSALQGIRSHDSKAKSAEAEEAQLRRFFESWGVSFPEGSSIRIEGDSLVIWNTPENLEWFDRCLCATDVGVEQIEIDCSFVAFPDKDLEAAARRAGRAAATTEDIRALWRSGAGRLVGTSKVVTRSGVETKVAGVTEILYPTEFERSEVRDPEHERYHPSHPPGSFETREIGLLWKVMATIGPDNRTIDLNVAPESAALPAWDDVGPSRTADGKTAAVHLRMPRFQSWNLSASVVLWDGSTIVLGGFPDPGRKETAYALISARVIEPNGRPPSR